jgi:hypothetical protein
LDIRIVSFILDLWISLVYRFSMKRILTFLFSVMLIFAGFGSVPRCYVMKPDCSERGNFQSALVHPETATIGCNGCPHLVQKTTRTQKTHTIPPVDRLARFSIDQERHSPDFSPDCVPIAALVQNSQISLVDPISDKEIFPSQLMSLPEPPLLILLQKQSFLI